jgi:hypothetical protein
MPLLTELEIWLGLVSTKMPRLRRWGGTENHAARCSSPVRGGIFVESSSKDF